MNMRDTDLQLLRRYVRQHDEDAFAELVRRHLNLVFCAALRQVRSVHLAEDVAQSVFTDLSHDAERLKPNTVLTAWLYQVTTRTAIDVVRREARRTLREQVAVELTAMNATAADWTAIEPLLDEAMNALDDGERTAVLLRYFENKSLREVGEMLSTTEEAARKRLSRAIDRLREFLTKRGITVGASSLAALISANSVQAAPAGLAAAITTAALSGTTITTAAVIAATKTIAMTTFQKAIIGATLTAVIGTGIYEARQAAKARLETQTLQKEQAPLQAGIEQLQSKLTEATNRLAALADTLARTSNNDHELLALRGEVGRLRRESQELAQSKSKVANDMIPLADKSWLDRVARLKQRLEQTPEAQIPELKLLTDDNWLNAAKGKLETDADFLSAFDRLRASGEFNFLQIADTALRKYLKSHHDEVPTELSQLTPYFDAPQPDEILTRYHIVPSSTIAQADVTGQTNGWLITLKTPDTGAMQAIGPNGFVGAENSQEMDILAPAMKAAFDAAPVINGRKSITLDDVAPYLATPEQKAAYQKVMQRRGSGSK